MATSTAQRVGIWVIAVVMLVGSVIVFVGVILANNNQSDDQANQAETQKQIEEAQKEMLKQLEPLDGYSATPFDADAVTALKKEDLKIGTGKEVAANSTLSVNYFGWTSDGQIFDSSKKSGTAAPVDLPLNNVIEGWKQGLPGAKEGGVRKLTIPSNLAYGEQGSPPVIQPNQPLAFIVEIKKVQ